MPIYDFGYRPYEGERDAGHMRWWAISRQGIRLAWHSKLLRYLVFFVFGPFVYFAGIFFAIGWATDPANSTEEFRRDMAMGIIAFSGVRTWGIENEQLIANFVAAPEKLRRVLWSIWFYYFLASTQTILSMLVVAVVGPGLIARDTRTRAYLIYFSKPITVWDYLLGKAGVLLFFILSITLFPALILYVISIAFAPSLHAVVDTWPVLVRVCAASTLIAIPTTLVMLALSALTNYERMAVFSWVALFIFGEVAWGAIGQTAAHVGILEWAQLVSIRQTMIGVCQSIFDIDGQMIALGASPAMVEGVLGGNRGVAAANTGVAFLAALCVGCILFLRARILAPIKI